MSEPVSMEPLKMSERVVGSDETFSDAMILINSRIAADQDILKNLQQEIDRREIAIKGYRQSMVICQGRIAENEKAFKLLKSAFDKKPELSGEVGQKFEKNAD